MAPRKKVMGAAFMFDLIRSGLSGSRKALLGSAEMVASAGPRQGGIPEFQLGV
jgi:hypothetical protein